MTSGDGATKRRNRWPHRPACCSRRGPSTPAKRAWKFPLERGSYYVVVENQAPAAFAPLGVTLPVPETSAYVSYSAEIGDR